MFKLGKNLLRATIRLHGTRGTVQIFERQTVVQFVTEFAWFHVNGLHK